jgi:hypothetical protein
MKWLEIVRFEQVYQLKRRSTWIMFGVLLSPLIGQMNGHPRVAAHTGRTDGSGLGSRGAGASSLASLAPRPPNGFRVQGRAIEIAPSAASHQRPWRVPCNELLGGAVL